MIHPALGCRAQRGRLYQGSHFIKSSETAYSNQLFKGSFPSLILHHSLKPSPSHRFLAAPKWFGQFPVLPKDAAACRREKIQGDPQQGRNHGVHMPLCCPRPHILIGGTRLQIHLWLCGTSIGPDVSWLFTGWCFPRSVAWMWTLITLSDYFLTAGC